MTDVDFRNQRRREFAGIFLSYTTEGQQSYRINWKRFTNHMDLPGGGNPIRGGCWHSSTRPCRAADRFGAGPNYIDPATDREIRQRFPIRLPRKAMSAESGRW